jgi:hypothetical protein
MEHATGSLSVQIASRVYRSWMRKSPMARGVVGRVYQRRLRAHGRQGCLPLPDIGMVPMPPVLPRSMEGIVAPAFCTVAVAVTGPAFVKVSVTGKRSPYFNVCFRPMSMM